MYAETVLDLCRFLRDKGFRAGVLASLTAVEVAQTLETAGIQSLQNGLRAALCTSKEEWDAFDGLFQSFLAGEPKPKRQQREPINAAAALASLNGIAASSGAETKRDAKTVAGASLYERLSRTDLSDLRREDQTVLERIAQRLFHEAAARLSRRLTIGGRQTTVDLRRTIHRSVGKGGDIVELRHRGRRPNKPRLVILVDISGSMNPYSLMLLRFAHAMQKQFRNTHTFVFSTHLVDVTADLRSRDANDALKGLSARTMSWSAGTRIGESLAQFNALYARNLLSRETVVMILSDGWDTGDPERLASALGAIRGRVRKLVWLNPLLGMEEYRPLTAGMAAALPYLDVFAPAHSLESLASLDKHLCSTNS
ncbi:MAG: VWA domain-containing protein [Acidobacteriaceae bacterium]|nr:VWA domain-containing protein [Acidobacteriaceae bacterium]